MFPPPMQPHTDLQPLPETLNETDSSVVFVGKHLAYQLPQRLNHKNANCKPQQLFCKYSAIN